MSWLLSCLVFVAGARLATFSLYVDTSASDALCGSVFLDFRIVSVHSGVFWLLVACLAFELKRVASKLGCFGMMSVKIKVSFCLALFAAVSVLASLKRLVLRVGLSIRGATSKRNATWLILPVVICLSQRLSHACAREIFEISSLLDRSLQCGLKRGIPSSGESSARVDSSLPFVHNAVAPTIEWSGEVLGSLATGRVTLRPRPRSGRDYAEFKASQYAEEKKLTRIPLSGKRLSDRRAQVPWKGARRGWRGAPSVPGPVAPRGAVASRVVWECSPNRASQRVLENCREETRMGAGDASRSDVERRKPVRPIDSGVDRVRIECRWPKPGLLICPWEYAVAGFDRGWQRRSRHGRAFGTLRGSCTGLRAPLIRPS
ncbi:hypothetical protein Tco_0648168 [Tanacetum coccineum]